MCTVYNHQQTCFTWVCCPLHCGVYACTSNGYEPWKIWQTQQASSSFKSQMSKPLMSHLKRMGKEKNSITNVSREQLRLYYMESIYTPLSRPERMTSSSDTFWCQSVGTELVTDSVGWCSDCIIYYFLSLTIKWRECTQYQSKDN